MVIWEMSAHACELWCSSKNAGATELLFIDWVSAKFNVGTVLPLMTYANGRYGIMALSGIGPLWLFRYGYGYSFGGNGNYGNYGMAVKAVTVKLKCCGDIKPKTTLVQKHLAPGPRCLCLLLCLWFQLSSCC